MDTTAEPQPRCPRCGGTRFSIEWRLVAKADGTYSLAGASPKVSAVNTPHLLCDDCGLVVKGHRDG